MAELDKSLLQSVPGLSEVIERFGYWPSFHDAEILSLLLDRESDSILKVHTFETLRELHESGHYRTTKHTVVCFLLSEIQTLELNDFSCQNVISGLLVSKTADGFTLTLGCCYGLCGSITAKGLRVMLESGAMGTSIQATTGNPQAVLHQSLECRFLSEMTNKSATATPISIGNRQEKTS